MNKIMLIGRLGKEPEMTYTPSGSPVTKFTLATDRRYTDKATGEKKQDTTWFTIVAWERLAETCNQYLHKGSKVYVEGRHVSRDYTDKDGVKRTVWDVIINDMEMLDNKPASGGDTAGASANEGESFPF